MSFLNYLSEQQVQLDIVELLIESEILEEQLNSFNDLPNAWKKNISFYNDAGENSKIITTNYKTKNESQFNKSISDAFKLSNEHSLIIISVFDQPFAMIYNTQSEYDPEKFKIITVNGSSIKHEHHTNMGRKYDYKSYVNTKEYFKTNAAKDKIKLELSLFAKSISSNEDDKKLTYSEIISNLDISISVVHADENRAEKRAERKENKKGATKSLTDNKKAVIRKFMKEVVTEIIEDIQKTVINVDDVDKILDDVINDKNVDITDIADKTKEKLSHLQRLLSQFSNAYKDGTIMDYKHYDGKGRAGYYIKDVLQAIKRYKDEFNKE